MRVTTIHLSEWRNRWSKVIARNKQHGRSRRRILNSPILRHDGSSAGNHEQLRPNLIHLTQTTPVILQRYFLRP